MTAVPTQADAPSVSVFSEPWWLDAVAPGQWREVSVTKGGRIVARLPYVLTKRHWLTRIAMPPLTQHLGPSLRIDVAKYASQLAEQKDLMQQLIQLLPAHDVFSQNFHHSVANWLPFFWAGFEQTTKYTYVLPRATDPAGHWSAFEARVRTDVRKAQKRLSIESVGDPRDIWRLASETYQRVGRRPPYNAALLERVHAAAVRLGRGELLMARDKAGRLHGAALFVWDAEATYYLVGGVTADGQSSSSSSLLLWTAIQNAMTRGTTFDFEGSMVESIERFFRGFGAMQQPYFHVSRRGRRARLIDVARDLVGAMRGAR